MDGTGEGPWRDREMLDQDSPTTDAPRASMKSQWLVAIQRRVTVAAARPFWRVTRRSDWAVARRARRRLQGAAAGNKQWARGAGSGRRGLFKGRAQGRGGGAIWGTVGGARWRGRKRRSMQRSRRRRRRAGRCPRGRSWKSIATWRCQ